MFSKAFIDGYENRSTQYSDFVNSEYSKEFDNGCVVRSIHLWVIYGCHPFHHDLKIGSFDENNAKAIEFLNTLNGVSFVNKLSVPISNEQVEKNLKWVDSLV